MTRENFIKIIKLRSKYETNTGNYTIPGGETLGDYIENLVISQLDLDNLAILENGNLSECLDGNFSQHWKNNFSDFVIVSGNGKNEFCTYEDMHQRINYLVIDIIKADQPY